MPRPTNSRLCLHLLQLAEDAAGDSGFLRYLIRMAIQAIESGGPLPQVAIAPRPQSDAR